MTLASDPRCIQRPCKRLNFSLKGAQFPRKIRDLPHVMKLIDVYTMSPTEALIEAAATNQVEWLDKLQDLPELDGEWDETAAIATEVAAAHGHCGVISLVHTWWEHMRISREEGRLERFMPKAIAGGHVAAFKLLLELYGGPDWLPDLLSQAVKSGQQEIVDIICKGDEYRETLEWAAKNGDLHVMKRILKYHQCVSEREVSLALQTASAAGHLDIVEFLIENFGGLTLDVRFALVDAVFQGHVEIAKYLYAKQECDVHHINGMLVKAARQGSLEMVQFFFDEGKRDADFFREAFVSAALGGHVEILKFLMSKPGWRVDPLYLGKAIVKAAKWNHLEALKLLYTSEGCQVSSQILETAFVMAAVRGNLEVVQFLDSITPLSPNLIVETFVDATRVSGEAIGDQAGVLGFLYDKGYIDSELINHIFLAASARCPLQAVEFLYQKGSISADSVEAAFLIALRENSADVLGFLYKTGFVSPTAVKKGILGAASRGDAYVLEGLLGCGCTTTRSVLLSALDMSSSIRARRLLARALKLLTSKEG